ncbi:hypothetical protein GALMADRAFT_206866 [Galerina marginata CBS 339.88]|uniref:Uncharacterized protein n=1 Tax=Galerina marginata (strain CBS 339.88) TaxID=685588 RepID=A0A067TJ55_GALM3|nr:hypothetical protein GALMADRAFT_206866 [Galerina marginata CBS 339.88]
MSSNPEKSKFYSRIVGGGPESRTRPPPHPAFNTFALTYNPSEYDGMCINPSVIPKQTLNLPPSHFPGHLPGSSVNADRLHRQPSHGPFEGVNARQHQQAAYPQAPAVPYVLPNPPQQIQASAYQQGPVAPNGITPPQLLPPTQGQIDAIFASYQATLTPTNHLSQIKCKWVGCTEWVSPENYQLMIHLRDAHGLVDIFKSGNLVECNWAPCHGRGGYSTGPKGLTQHIRVTHLDSLHTRMFKCPYCAVNVRLVDRESHFAMNHPGVMP